VGDDPVPGRAGQGLPARGVHRRLGPLLPTCPRGIRTIRTTLICAGQPWYGLPAWYGSIRTTQPPWYGSIRTTKPIRTAPEQEKRAWYGWYGYPAMATRGRHPMST